MQSKKGSQNLRRQSLKSVQKTLGKPLDDGEQQGLKSLSDLHFKSHSGNNVERTGKILMGNRIF